MLEPFSDKYFKIGNKEGKNLENYKSYGMGLVILGQSIRGRDNVLYTDAHINIVPTIHFINTQTEEIFKEKYQSASDKTGRIFKVGARKVTIYSDGLIINVNHLDLLINETKPYFFELRNGMYYEVNNDDNMKNFLVEYDFDKISSYTEDPNEKKYFWWYDVNLFEDGKKHTRTIIQGVEYFKPMKEGLWLITPYGNYIFDYNTKTIQLVSIDRFEGFEFYSCDESKLTKLVYGKVTRHC
jgi:hypothetical protein